MIRRTKPLRRSTKPIPRRVRPKARRQTERAGLERTCDRLWRKAVLGSFEAGSGYGYCWNCIQRRATDAAHIISRRFKATRWMLANGRALCRPCHDHYTCHPQQWVAVIISREGEVFWNQMVADSYLPKPDLTATKRALEAA